MGTGSGVSTGGRGCGGGATAGSGRFAIGREPPVGGRVRFDVLLERADAPLGILALQTRVEFRGEGWMLVGVAPSESQISSLIILARAVADK